MRNSSEWSPSIGPGSSFLGLWFRAGNTQVHLIENFGGAANPGDPNVTDKTMAGVAAHFAFRVADAAAAADHLRDHGVRIMGGPVPRPDGPIQVWFFDPDGHVVEVFSPANN